MEPSILLSRFLSRAAELGGAEHAGYAVAALAEALCGRRKPFSEGIEYRQCAELLAPYGEVTEARLDALLRATAGGDASAEGFAFRRAMFRARERAKEAKNHCLYADVFYRALLETPSPAVAGFLRKAAAPAPKKQTAPVGSAATPSAAPRPTRASQGGTLDAAMRKRIEAYREEAYQGYHSPTNREIADHLGIPDTLLYTPVTDREFWRRVCRARFGFVMMIGADGVLREHRVYCGDGGVIIADESGSRPVILELFSSEDHFKNCLGFRTASLSTREGRDVFDGVFVSWRLNVYFADAMKYAEALAVAGYEVSLYYDKHDRFWYEE